MKYFVLICRGATLLTLVIPRKVIDDYKDNLNNSADESGAIKHYHIVIHKEPDGKVTLLLSKPSLKRIDITDFVV